MKLKLRPQAKKEIPRFVSASWRILTRDDDGEGQKMFVIKPILLKKFQKALSLFLAVLILVNQLVVPVAYAEEENDAGATLTPTAEVSPSPAPTDQAPTDQSPTPTDQAPSSSDSSNQGSEVTPSPSPNIETPSPTPAIQTITPSPEPTQTPTPPVESVSLSPTPTPQSTITTGNANASSQTDTTVNKNQDTISGNISTQQGSCAPPEGETNCQNDINISNNNQATVSGATDSLANTGDNQESGSGGDATIITGNATASGEITNDINSNTVILKDFETLTPTPTLSEDNTPVACPFDSLDSSESTTASDTSLLVLTTTPTPSAKDLVITNNNEGELSNEANIFANTGGNLAAENLGNVDLKTGDASAWVNLINFLNTNILGSNFQILVLNIAEDNKETNLNEVWKELQAQNSPEDLFLVSKENSSLNLFFYNQNQAVLENKITVCATTGDNQAKQNNSVSLNTGNATAVANVNNLVNTNILGSNFFFGILNITGDYSGNLILPRPERFLTFSNSTGSGTPVIFENQNTANIENNLASIADTGNNQISNNGGNNVLKTGSAFPLANSLSLVNLNLYRNDWFYVLTNVLGDWSGKVYSWSNPGAIEEKASESQSYEVNNYSSTSVAQEIQSNSVTPTPIIEFQNQNNAEVRNDIQVVASTGGNQVSNSQAKTTLTTGNAKSAVNLFNFVNLNILSSRWFLGLVNILGKWSGNLIYAYPDVTVSLSEAPEEVLPGESFEYVISFSNQGYDEAENVILKMDFPQGLLYEGDNSGFSPSCFAQTCSWQVGNLARGEQGSFRIKVKVDPEFFNLNKISFWQKIIPQVYAAEEKESLVVQAEIFNSVPESDLNNNFAEKSIGVLKPGIGGSELSEDYSSQSENIDQRQPILEITAKNNVNGFVYLGDTVSFEVTIENKGEVPAYNAVFVQKLYNHVPGDLGTITIPLGTINPGKKGKLTFGLLLKKDSNLQPGDYYTLAVVEATAPNQNKVSSNQARTNFALKLQEVSSLFLQPALAQEEPIKEVLGVASECPETKENIYPYIMLFVLSSLWIVEKSRKFSRLYLRKK